MSNLKTFFKPFTYLFLITSGFITKASAQYLCIYHIDVERVDATLLVSPLGRTFLVDSGKNGQGDRLKATMDEAGVTQIDAFVCTHYHEDHYGGIDNLVNDYNVRVLETYDRDEKNRIPNSKINGRMASNRMTNIRVGFIRWVGKSWSRSKFAPWL